MKNWVATCVAVVCVLAAGCSSKTPSTTTSTSGGPASSAPSGTEAANAKVALVRFVDGVPEGSASLSFGDTQLFSNVAYKTVTPYKEVADERHDFRLITDRTPTNAKPVTDSEGLTKGSRYTVVAALDKNGAEKLNVINDSLSAPTDGKAKLRVINASAAEVDLYAPVSRNGSRNEGTADRAKHPTHANPYTDEDKWFGGVNANSSTSFKDVRPYEGNVDVVASGHGRRSPSAQVPVDLKAGEISTVVVAGGTRKHPLEAVKIDDHLNLSDTASR